MNFQKHFPWTSFVFRAVTGRMARRIYLCLFFLLIFATTAARIRTFLLAREIRNVLNGLEHLRVDQTTEEELLKTIPQLVRNPYERHVGSSVERFYYLVIANRDGWLMRFNLADWLGYRYVDFSAQIVVLDGRVSSIRYGFGTETIYPRPLGALVSVKSVHGFWSPHAMSIPVTKSDDESPEFRVAGDETNLNVTYTFDAPPEVIAHAFHLNLSCLWSLRGCRSAQQVAPLLWRDKQRIDSAAVARLQSSEPCPDRLLAGRVRYLLDMDVLLFEPAQLSPKAGHRKATLADVLRNYKLSEVIIRGSGRSWDGTSRDWPSLVFEKGQDSASVGGPLIFFANVEPDSCLVAPATPSALLAIRATTRAPRRTEDLIVRGLL